MNVAMAKDEQKFYDFYQSKPWYWCLWRLVQLKVKGQGWVNRCALRRRLGI